jgi:hypothetical protein
MPIWSDFLESLTGVAKAVGGAFAEIPKGVASTLLQSGASLGATTPGSGLDPVANALAGRSAALGTKKSLEKAGIEVGDTGPLKVLDPVLKVAVAADEYVFTPLIKRPLATGFLVTDPDSPLYKKPEFQKGFQLSDIAEAWERTGNVYETIGGEKYLKEAGVSLGQAFNKSLIAEYSPIGQVQNYILREFGGIDLDKIDLWDNEDIKKNFVDNPVGRFISGTNDFFISEVAINLAFGGAGRLLSGVTKAAGLRTKFRAEDFDAMADFSNKVDEHLKFRATNGAEGSYYNIGEDVERMAAAAAPMDVIPIAKKYTYNSDAIDLITQTTDPRLVRDYILMDKGDFGAYQRLVASGNADDAWAISKAGNEIINDYLINGKVREYTPEQRARWMQAHDDAIRKDPDNLRLFNTFFDAKYDDANKMVTANPRFLDTNYKPMEPIIGRELLGTVRTKASQVKSKAIQRDFSDAPGIAKTILASRVGGPVTVLMRAVGTYMPNGFVSHSSLRPTQGIQELISVFDDIPLFSKGDSVITTRNLDKMTGNFEKITVSQYRNNILREYLGLRSDGAKNVFVKRLNNDIAYTIAYSRGFFDDAIIQKGIDSLTNDIYSVHKQLVDYGYAMTPNNARIATNEKTQRMLANSTPMIPFGKLDAMILRESRADKNIIGPALNVGQRTASGARTLFELGNKAFSFAQLYRFSYIPKNSIFEPLLASFFAEGGLVAAQAAGSLAGRTVNAFTNTLGRGYAKTKSALPKTAIGEVNKELKSLNKQLGMAIAYRDQRYAEFYKYFFNVDGVSPKTKGAYADEIRTELRNAEKIIADLEDKLNVYTVETYSKNIKDVLEVPSIYTLGARIETLKKAGAARYGSEIRTAEIALSKAVGDMNSLAPDLITIDKSIETAYKNIGKILDDIKPQLKKEAELLSIADAKYTKKRNPPKMQRFLTADGQTIEFPSFSDRRFFGDGYVSEISNASDRTVEILGNKLAVGRVRGLIRNNYNKITRPSDPQYFGELEFVVNNRMRGDELVDKILAGADRPTLLAWGKSQPGRSYVLSRGKEVDDYTEVVDDTIRYVNSLLPTPDAKALALKGPVNQLDLQKVLADKIDQLTVIQPLDVDYANPGLLASLNNGFDTAFASLWRQLLKSENIIREAYANAAHARIVTEKARALEAAGQTVTYDTLMSLRRGAAVEIVDNLKKVMYTIPRQHRALYMSRLAVVFPNAAFSGLYRYTGFAVRQPRRTAGFLNAYHGLYNTFAVDRFGEPVENPEDAEYLLIPGSKELGFNDGKGLIVSTRATNYLANLPGPNYFIPVPIAMVYKNKPNAEETLRTLIDKSIGEIPGFSYDELFPYGINVPKKQLTSAFTPSWARDLALAFSADETNIQYREALENEAQRLNILAEMGLRKPPTYKEIVEGTKASYYRRFFNKFFSIIGTPQVLGQYGVGLYEDYYQMLIDINKAKAENIKDPAERRKALAAITDETEKQFLAQMKIGDNVDFPMDRLFKNVRTKTAYFPTSTAAYERIYEDYKGLAKVLENNAPETVGLLAADLPYEYNGQIAKFLNDPNATLPGGTLLNSQIKNRKQVETELELSRFWASYAIKIKSLNAAAREAEYASYRSVEEAVAEKDRYVNEVLGPASPKWLFDYTERASKGDKAFVWADAMETIVQDKNDGTKNRFMKQFGDTQFWVHTKNFVELRNKYVKTYENAERGSKGAVQNAWRNRIAETLDLWDPTLQKILIRYFENDNLQRLKEDKD